MLDRTVTQVRRALRHPAFAASLLVGVILALTGAFGSHMIVLPLRLVYWLSSVCVAAACLVPADRLLSRYSRHSWIVGAASAVIAAVPTAFVAAAVAALLISAPISLPRLAAFYPAALVLNLSLLVTWRLIRRREVLVEAATADVPDDSVPPAIASKLPPRLTRSRLVVVEAQDHYLRVATHEGDALVYMRFADALAALEGSDGARVHRSWWVARTSIESTSSRMAEDS